MKPVLLVEASPRFGTSRSRMAAEKIIGRLADVRPGLDVLRRDLVAEPLMPLDEAFTEAIYLAPPALSAAEREALAQSERLIEELEQSGTLIISTPMHNFTVPAVLKAWIDQVLRLNRTFRSTPSGKVGLLADRPTYVVVSTGGAISGERARQPDFLTPYLDAILRTLGIHTIRFLHLEAMPRGSDWPDEAERQVQAWLDIHLPARTLLPAS
ncbi:FMN-dependent NADH-azoreductase [Enhydrobacter aerosaccus]|uniref:FMN dependent NADH:quinone oxidoreductase n=1 Tax=Enhydrobacter aerosaccus TaxID=225324 RepID=A0A1T4T9I0_9HYPH|nr:NAD(P)H-dependent oxidoreductase [Enhydrobacter aerosaccus]SKA37144.1 FMN-dependent NADH-azoreductase [Enhydrobacter aerosaccus]